MVVARSFAQHAGGPKNTPRFLDQKAGAEVRRGIHAQLEPKDEQSASVVGQVVRGVVFAKVLEVPGHGAGVVGEHGNGFGARARHAMAPREGEQVDGALRRRIGVPRPAFLRGTKAPRPGAPQGADPGRIDAVADHRQPGEAVQPEKGLGVGEAAPHQRVLLARRHGDGFGGQGQRDRGARLGGGDFRVGQSGWRRRRRRQRHAIEIGGAPRRERRRSGPAAERPRHQPAPQHRVAGHLRDLACQGLHHGYGKDRKYFNWCLPQPAMRWSRRSRKGSSPWRVAPRHPVTRDR